MCPDADPLAGRRARAPGAIGLAVFVAALLAPRVALQWAGPDAQLSLMMDDASYYFEAARRALAGGTWPSADGVHPTNGFHPLYLLVVTAVQAAVGEGPRALVSAMMAFNLACNSLAVVLLARFVVFRDEDGRGAAGVAAAVLLALSPGWLVHGTIGVENSLSSLLVLAAVLQWDRRYGGVPPAASWGRAARDGALLGLAALGRSDALLLAGVYALAGAWRMRPALGPAGALREVVALGAGAAAVLAPWWIANLAMFGTIAQDSGVALAARFARDYGPHTSAVSLRAEATGVAFWLYRFLWAGGLVPLTAWLLAVAMPFERLRSASRTGRSLVAVVVLAAASLLLRANDPTDVRDIGQAALELALAVPAFGFGLVCARPVRVRMRAVHGVAFAAAALTVAAYAIGFRGFQVWYASGFSLAAVLFAAWGALPAMLRGRRAFTAALLALLCVQSALVVRGWLERGGREGMDRALFANGEALRGRLEAFAASRGGAVKIGSFDSGEFAFRVHPFPIVNADGVMNHAAAVAIRDGSLARWMRAEGVTHLVTSPLRIAQYRRVENFPAVYDSAASAAIGMETYLLDWAGAPAGR
ncbi:MAG: hypothetical protein HZA61_08260 [Candidatus Eisenbacteria bacterium]|uniref:Glycosyltransferase RgtA/B/C/D-like domain-containing protein n=1 Tax=Eiseniibacteriota bacterium TaxID=2212470 RepID=A0A933W1W7_UNCEI|nr:hypothetical protein [Candidatus Eisenbacteria bacterium]